MFFWYRLTRVFPDKFHRAVKRLCVVCVLIRYQQSLAFSALMLLVGQWEGHPASNEWWDAGVVMSGLRCRFAYGPADATATHYLLL